MERLKSLINTKNKVGNTEEDRPKFITGYKIFIYVGLVRDGRSFISTFSFVMSRIWFITGAVFFLKPIFFPDKTLKLSDTVNLLHYATFNVGCLAGALGVSAKSTKFKSYCQLLQDEFKQPKIKLSPAQEEILINTNKFCWKFLKIMTSIYYSAAVTNCLKGPLLEGLPFPFKCWVPINTDSSFAYWSIFLVQLGFSLNCGTNVCICMAVYVIHAKQLCSQFDILLISIKETFDNSTNYNLSYIEREYQIRYKMRQIIERHQLLLRCFNLFGEVYSWLLLSMTMTSAALICTNIFMITDPHNDPAVIFEFSALLTPEIILIAFYCSYGQRLSDRWKEVSDTVYKTEWFNESLRTRKTIVFLMAISSRAKIIRGVGLQPFTWEGFGEILKGSFSYFNMLKALR